MAVTVAAGDVRWYKMLPVVQDQCGIMTEFDSTKDSLFPDNPFICRTPSNAVIDMQGRNPYISTVLCETVQNQL